MEELELRMGWSTTEVGWVLIHFTGSGEAEGTGIVHGGVQGRPWGETPATCHAGAIAPPLPLFFSPPPHPGSGS